MAHCSAMTKKGHPCPIHADREHEGKPVCHIHDPGGNFQENVRRGTRPKKNTKTKSTPSFNHTAYANYNACQNSIKGIGQPQK